MLIQAALNGSRTTAAHPALPISAEELAADAVRCVAAGAGTIHIHPRDQSGCERLDAKVIDAAVRTVRDAAGVPVGVSTGAWIEPDLEARVALVASWSSPDFASVNLCEQGAERVVGALLSAGIAVEAGVASVDDAEVLFHSGLSPHVTRVLVEPRGVACDDAIQVTSEIHRALDHFAIGTPRLQHGEGEATWVLIADAIRKGYDTRVGLEDTCLQPNGARTTSNEELVRAATSLLSGVR